MTRRYIIHTGVGLAATAIIAVGGVAAANGESHRQAGVLTTDARVALAGATGGTGLPSDGARSGGMPGARPPKGAKLPPGIVLRSGTRPSSPSATTSAS